MRIECNSLFLDVNNTPVSLHREDIPLRKNTQTNPTGLSKEVDWYIEQRGLSFSLYQLLKGELRKNPDMPMPDEDIRKEWDAISYIVNIIGAEGECAQIVSHTQQVTMAYPGGHVEERGKIIAPENLGFVTIGKQYRLIYEDPYQMVSLGGYFPTFYLHTEGYDTISEVAAIHMFKIIPPEPEQSQHES